MHIAIPSIFSNSSLCISNALKIKALHFIVLATPLKSLQRKEGKKEMLVSIDIHESRP